MKPEQLAARLQAGKLKSERVRLLPRMLAVAERAVKRRTPVRRGTLRRSITTRVIVAGERGAVGTNLSYARPVHFGSKAHIIRPKTKKALFWPGAAHPVKAVRHPGTKANPFMTNGLDDARPEIERLAQAAGEKFFAEVAK